MRQTPPYSGLPASPETTLMASSEYGGSLVATAATASSSRSWSAATNNDEQWIQADFGRVIMVEEIRTRGRGDSDQWVTSFRVSTSLDGDEFEYIADPLDVYSE